MARAARTRRSARSARSARQTAGAGARSAKTTRASTGKLGRGKRYATGIDIGHYSVKIMSVAGDDAGKVVVRKVTVAPVPAPEGPEYPEELHARQKEALKDAVRQHGKMEGRIVLGLPRDCATVRYLTLPSTNSAEIRDMLLYDVERHVPFPLDEMELSFQIIETMGDHESRIMMVCAPRKEIEPYIDICREAGVDADVILLNTLADSEAYRRTLSDDEIAAVVNFGRSSVTLAVVKSGTLMFSRSLPISERRLLEGFAGAKSWKDLQGRITAAGPLNPQERDHFSQWVDKVGLELMRSMSAFLCEHNGAKVNRMILCGGAGYFPAGPPTGLHLRVKTNAAIETPFNGLLPPSDSYRGAELATSFGLALRGLRKGEDTVSLLPQAVAAERAHREASTTRKNIIILFMMAVMLLGGAGYLKWFQQYRAQSIVAEEFRSLRTETNRINQMKARLDTVESYLDHQHSALRVLQGVLETLPDRVYIRNITFQKRRTLEITGLALNQQDIDALQGRLIVLSNDASGDRFFTHVEVPRTNQQQLVLHNQRMPVVEFQIRCELNYRDNSQQQGARR